MSAIAVIDTTAFAANVAVLVDRAAPAEVMLAVKADAYGHGMSALAPLALEAGARSLAVLEVPAALELRAQGIRAPLFAWLHGEHTDFVAAIEAEVELGVSTRAQLAAIASAATPARPALVHLKIDTGLHRNGASPAEWPLLVAEAREAQQRGLIAVDGIWSHLADASPAEDLDALDAFERALALAAEQGVHPRIRHVAASSAGWREPRARYDRVRFGIAAYGISPFDDATGQDLGLRAVLSLQSTVSADEAPEGMRWVAAGFADGVPVAAHGAHVSIGGRRHPVVAVDVDRTLVGEADSVRVDDTVVIVGEPAEGQPSAEEWAAWSGTIGDEIVTGVPPRVPRDYR